VDVLAGTSGEGSYPNVCQDYISKGERAGKEIGKVFEKYQPG